MKKWGIAIYNDKASLAENKAYIDRASQYGFSRIFSCLLSIDVTKKEQVINELHQVNDYAKQKGMEVILDVNPRVFQDLGIGYKDLSFFKQTGADGIRLDIGFTGAEEALMTFNPEGLMIEINMSIDTHAIDTIIDYMPNTNRLIGCHNFYPHRYTGLTEPFFLKTSHAFKQYGLRTAAFISSNEATFGPWAIMEGLPTLELLRNLPIDVQAKYMILQNGLIDDVIISNCFASEAELRQVGQLRKEYVEFAVDLVTDIPATDRAIVLEELHVRRGDINEYVIRSSQPRVKYKGHQFNAFNTPDIKRGDVIIETSEYGHYAGELQIALQDMKNSGKSNVVARVREAELFLLDRIQPWQKFGFVVNSNNE